jgi:hypothetical protein
MVYGVKGTIEIGGMSFVLMVRIRTTQVAALARSIQSTQTLLPQIPLLDGSIASLQQQLLRVRGEANELSEALEVRAGSRWQAATRLLCCVDFRVN